jgi:hypothetical protein
MESLELQKRYAGMTDEELTALASDAYDLTETAQQALRSEIAKRGLKIMLEPTANAQPGRSIEEDEDLESSPDEPDDVSEEDLRCTARCPKCRSEEIVFDRREVEPGREPGPDAKFDWHCDACGHVWEDDGIEETDA